MKRDVSIILVGKFLAETKRNKSHQLVEPSSGSWLDGGWFVASRIMQSALRLPAYMSRDLCVTIKHHHYRHYHHQCRECNAMRTRQPRPPRRTDAKNRLQHVASPASTNNAERENLGSASFLGLLLGRNPLADGLGR